MVESTEKHIEFITAEYSHYCELMRMYLQLSWQIPAFTVVAVAALVGFSSEKLSEWQDVPLIPAVMFLFLGLFVAVLFVHHSRNMTFVRAYGQALLKMEIEYGVDPQAHHFQIASKLTGWRRFSSTTALAAFLAVLAVGLLGLSVYFFALLL